MENSNYELELVRWCAEQSSRATNEYLKNIPIEELKNNPVYALKWFLYRYAYERAGASKGYKIAAIKSIYYLMQINHNLAGLDDVYINFYLGRKNKNGNPCFDQRIQSLNFSEIIKNISDGKLELAFNQLKLRGIGHKIRALFIRDIITITDSEKKFEHNFENYLYAQPIDTWVRSFGEELLPPNGFNIPPELRRSSYDSNIFSERDFGIACKLIEWSLRAKVSPLKVNQGIWYFCSRVVADNGRLRKILNERKIETLNSEVDLMDGFIQGL